MAARRAPARLNRRAGAPDSVAFAPMAATHQRLAAATAAADLGRGPRAHAGAGRAALRRRRRDAHSPLMSPLVWDLAHIAAYEDLWLVHRHGGGRCCSPSWPRCTTRSRRRAPCAATCRCSTARRRSRTSPRCASARSQVLAERGTGDGDARSSSSSATSSSTARRCCRRSSSRAWCRAPALAPDPRPRRPAATPASSPSRCPAGPCTIGAGRVRLRLRQRAPAPPRRAPRLPDRPHAGHQRHLADVRRGRRLRAPRVVERRGLVVEGGLRHHPPGRLGPRPGRLAAVANRRMGAAGPRRARRPRLLVRGRRLRPRTRRPPPDGGRVGEGGDLGPGHGKSPPVPVGRRAARPAPGQPRPAGLRPASGRRVPRRRVAVRRARHARRRLGVDRERLPRLRRLPPPTPTASTPRSSSAPTTRCCAAARGRAARAWPPPTFRNWDLPAAAPDLLGRAAGVGRVSTGDRRLPGSTPGRRGRRAHARRRRARRADPAVQGAAAEAPLRHARLGAVRPDLRAARVLPDPHRARDPRRRAPPRSSRRPGGRAGRARLRHARPRPACCSTHGPRPGRSRATCPSTSPSRSCATARATLRGRYPGLDMHGIVGDFERHLGAIPPPEPGRRACSPSSAARSATSCPARAGASCASSRALLGPDDRAAARDRPRQGPRRARGRLRRRGRRHRRVQPQRPDVHQPRARRRLPGRALRARRVLRPRATSGSRCACARGARAS